MNSKLWSSITFEGLKKLYFAHMYLILRPNKMNLFVLQNKRPILGNLKDLLTSTRKVLPIINGCFLTQEIEIGVSSLLLLPFMSIKPSKECQNFSFWLFWVVPFQTKIYENRNVLFISKENLECIWKVNIDFNSEYWISYPERFSVSCPIM